MILVLLYVFLEDSPALIDMDHELIDVQKTAEKRLGDELHNESKRHKTGEGTDEVEDAETEDTKQNEGEDQSEKTDKKEDDDKGNSK